MLGNAVHDEVGLLKYLNGLRDIAHGLMDASLEQCQLGLVMLLECALFVLRVGLLERVENLKRANVLLVLEAGQEIDGHIRGRERWRRLPS